MERRIQYLLCTGNSFFIFVNWSQSETNSYSRHEFKAALQPIILKFEVKLLPAVGAVTMLR